MNKIWHSLCPIRQYNDKIDFYCNSFKRGHYKIIYYNTMSPETIYEYPISFKEFTIKGLSEIGEYVFYTVSEKEQSIKTYVDFIYETPEEKIEELKQSLNNFNEYHLEALELLLNNLKKDESKSSTIILTSLYRDLNTSNPEKLNAFIELIHASQNCENKKTLYLNKSNLIDFTIFNKASLSIKASYLIDKVNIYKYNDEKKIYVKTLLFNADRHLTVPLEDDNIFIFEACFNENILGQFIYYSGDEYAKSYLFEKTKQHNENLSKVLNKPINIPSYFNFKEDEIKIYQKEIAKTPFATIFDRPTISLSGSKAYIEFNDLNFILNTNKQFYITAKDNDFLLDSDIGFRQLITSNPINFNILKTFGSSIGTYSFYIQDANGTIVSKISTVNIEDQQLEYLTKIHQLDLYKFEKKFIKRLEKKDSRFLTTANAVIGIVKDADAVNTLHIHRSMVEQLNNHQHSNSIKDIITTSLEEQNSNIYYLSDFFDNGIKFDKIINKLVFPPKDSKYLLTVEKFGLGEDISVEHFESSSGAIEYRIWPNYYYIFQAIDLNNYCKSGFLFVDYTNKTLQLNNWNIKVEGF